MTKWKVKFDNYNTYILGNVHIIQIPFKTWQWITICRLTRNACHLISDRRIGEILFENSTTIKRTDVSWEKNNDISKLTSNVMLG